MVADTTLIGIASLIILGVSAQWIAWRLRLPSILLLLIFGFLAGPATGLLRPDELLGDLLFPIISLSVAIILFEGGLSLKFSELPRIGSVIFLLISVGMAITWSITALSAHYIMGLDWQQSMLLGAILVVTGPTVIGPLLRQIRPRGQAAAVLKWEGILIDPIGAVMAVLVFEVILRGELSQAPSVILTGVLQTVLVGLVFSVAGAGIFVFLMRRYWIPDYLQNGAALLVALGGFAVSNMVQPEAGLLTVTLLGVFLANQRSVPIRHIIEFKENLRVLLIGTLFILLSARVQLDNILALGGRGVLFLLIVVLLARPIAVFISTIGSDLSRNERIFIGWMAPRGIVAASVASVFTFELAEAGLEGVEQLVADTFLIIVGTVSIYGLTAGPLARRLGLSEQNPQGILFVGGHKIARTIGKILHDLEFSVVLLDTNRDNIAAGEALGLNMHYGDALSEDVIEEIELTGIGRLLAITPNNEVNSLATFIFPELFGRAEMYQLPYELAGDLEGHITQHINGRFLFNNRMTFRALQEAIDNGAHIEAMQLTETHNYVSLQSTYQNQLVPLFLVTDNQQLIIYTVDYQPIPKEGQTLVALVPSGGPVTAVDEAPAQASESE